MKLKLLGTSNANPNPGLGQSGLLLELAGRNYLFDCGDGIPTKLWLDNSIVMNNIDAVFITHYHPDHVGGLFSFLLLMEQRLKASPEHQPGRDGVLEIFIPGLAGADGGPGKDAEALTGCFTGLTELFHLSDDRTAYKKKFILYRGTKEIYRSAGLEVSCFPTLHNREAHGFVITARHKKLVYSGDIMEPGVLAPFITDAELVIIESAHFPLAAIPPVFRGKRVKTVLLNHMLDERIRDYIAVLEELKPLAGECNILIARDGMELPLG